jgi:AcrR family transcriptional regulator
MVRTSRRRAPAEQTRSEILRAAEAAFAERGFAEARLEDVASRVGVTRAALFHHFTDKRALYEAVIEDAFGTLLDRARALFSGAASLSQAIENAVNLWVDTVWDRPAIAHLLLREATNRSAQSEAFQRLCGPALGMLQEIFARGERSGEFRPVTRNPFHFVSMIAGGSVFFVAAMPSLAPDLPFDPMSPEQREAHRADVQRVARRLLGLGPHSVPGPV